MVLSRMPNDCVVTALANYTGHSYDEVFRVLDAVRGSNEGQGYAGYYKETWLFALKCLLGRTPQQGQLLTHGLLRFKHKHGLPGHIVVIQQDGTVVDGSLFHGTVPLSRYTRVYPYYEIDEVWQ